MPEVWNEDLLPAAGLVTSSEEYYPTVAINALMRSLRDPALSSHHFEVRLLDNPCVMHLPFLWTRRDLPV